MSLLNDKQRDNPSAPKLFVDVKAVRNGLVVYPSSEKKINEEMERVPLTDTELIGVLRAMELTEGEKNETCLHSDLMEQTGHKRQRLHEKLKTLKNLRMIVSAGRGKSALTLLGRDTIATAMRAASSRKSAYGAVAGEA